jgi:hypothetical protein
MIVTALIAVIVIPARLAQRYELCALAPDKIRARDGLRER